MSKPSAPKPPDPQDTSAAQTGTSVSTAIANTMMGNVNQVGPDGSSLTYDQSGSYDFTDPYTGQTYTLPTFTATQQLSDSAQGIYDTNQQTQGNLADIGANQSGFLRDYLGEPASFDTSDTSNYLYDLGATRLDPRIQRERASLEQQLANQGVVPGSEAWDARMGVFNQGANDAYNDLLLDGNQQAMQMLMAERNQPINEIMALLSGSQVQMPNFSVNQPSSVPTTDNAGLINANYGQKQQNYQQQMNQWNSTMGGLFGLGSSALMGM